MTSFTLDGWLPGQQRRVEALLQSRMEAIARRSPARLSEAMRYSLLEGGKRLRPVLCLTFADTVARASNGGGEPGNDAACALECVHTYSLVHDDLPAMDDDDLRRGRPTNHKVFGEALAILAGDALLTDAFTLLATGPVLEQAVRGRLVAELALAAGAGGMVGGQVLDIAEDRLAALDYLTRLHRMKTGALIKAACRMGAIAGGGDERALQAAEIYGDAVGLAFQIADDILDVTASAQAMGKPTGADAAAGRHTFPAVVGLEAAQALAASQVTKALAAVRELEGADGPLAALARYSVDRSS
jgi:geranylgeranyl diphosphate synthase type II